MRRLLLLFPAALLLLACGGEPTFHRPAVIVLGFDGMDPILVDRGIARGRLPHFARLARDGDYSRLGTSLPPESPVAWANFITGLDSGGNGLFDFVHREFTKDGIRLVLASSHATEPSHFLPIAGYRIPLSPGGIENALRGTPFWERLVKAGVPCSIVRIPDNYPPVDVGARTFSGMGTPDLRGTPGTFTYYTEKTPDNLPDFAGKGDVQIVKVRDGVVHAELLGPDNTFLPPEGPRRRSPPSRVDVSIYPDRERRAARIDVGEETRILAVGEWSDWIPVSFELIPHLATADGIVRLFLKSTDPLEVYASPVNIDPRDPAQPVSAPADAAEELAAEIGPYYTQGMAEETHGVQVGVLDTKEFIEQSQYVLDERRKMLNVALDRFRRVGGFTFFYFSSTDLCAHILWRLTDPTHPDYDAEEAKKYGGALDRVYEEMDDALGQVMASVPEGTRIVVMSDHGFASLRRKVSLNTWLLQNGFLRLRDPDRQGELDGYRNVNWLQTEAYGVGFAGICLNLRGREPVGIVGAGEEANRVEKAIIEGLESLVDPENGQRIVKKVYRREDVYHGPAAKDGPDLVVGFYRGYENMDDSVLGKVPKELIEDNRDAWSGSHLMDPSQVPGILLANRKFDLADPGLRDLTVTLLAEFGVTAPELPGRRIWK